MRRALLLAVSLAGCVETRTVALTFGPEAEGLDGFMCRDATGQQLIGRAPAGRASLVLDFVALGGVPGCRTGQMISWCKEHTCAPLPTKRVCVDVTLPAPNDDRSALRASLAEALKGSGAAVDDSPDEFVMVRVVGTAQSCASLAMGEQGDLPPFDKSLLVGCAYSCPVLLDKVEEDVYLGFETFQDGCEQSIKTCSDDNLTWEP